MVAYLALVVVLPALLLGHQGQDFPPLKWWRAVRARQAREARCTPVSRPQCPLRLPLGLRGAPEPAQSRSRRPVPSWAHTEPYTHEETA
ncbi:hypothetical protein ACGFNY_04950 [Streptomyces chartreusis]|uniref:hypothetical protein n=1 Tax=Streptomyces chartreusis TaxID=1969 RepID=UPI003711B634